MRIEMPRGDLRSVRFTVLDVDGTAFTETLDEIYFTVKPTFSSKSPLFQKRLSDGGIQRLDDSSYQFTIQPGDTDGLTITKYVFDIELVRAGEIKQTTVGELVLTNEVTYAADEV